jgi:DHA1 family multidrug resistance protein-like MFS transporter
VYKYLPGGPGCKGWQPNTCAAFGTGNCHRGSVPVYIDHTHNEERDLTQSLSSTRSWKRTLYAVGVGEILAIAGFGTSTPITPLYLQELGVTDPARLKLLTGLVQALPSISLTGTIAAATIMVASISPREEVGYGLGLLQMAIFLGASIGPLFGGVIADLFGLRANFFATAFLLLGAGLVIARFAEDNFSPPLRRKTLAASMLPDFRPLARSRALWSLMAVIAADQIAGSVTSPFLPLYVQQLRVDAAHIASTTGAIIGLGAVASALAAIIVGRFSHRLGYRRVLIVCMTGAALFIVPQAFVRSPIQLLILRMASCFFVGGNLPSVNALIAQKIEAGKQGSIYGISSSIASGSNALGPVIGASIALAGGYSPVFLTTAGIMAAAGIGIGAFVRGTKDKPSTPAGLTAT